MIDWLLNHYIEILGVISGLLFLYFEYKEDARLWPLGILTSTFYIVVFYQSKFYADMGLQVYYLIISIYGWMVWIRGAKNNADAPTLQIKRANKTVLVRIVLISVFLWVGLYFLLSEYTDSPVPLGDAFTSAFAITATWMLSRKMLEQWYFWMIINALSSLLYLYRDLYLTAILFVVYAIISVAGFYEWRRKMTLP